MTVNIFDFSDTSDLPADLQSRMAGPGGINPNIDIYAGIVEAASGAGLSVVTISTIEAIAFRMELPPKGQATIRLALNAAVVAGRLVKPSRQSYAVAGKADTADLAPPLEVADATDDSDPLA